MSKELREQYQIDVQKCISLLNSMVVGGENHSESSEKILLKGYHSLSSLCKQLQEAEEQNKELRESVKNIKDLLLTCYDEDYEDALDEAIKIFNNLNQQALNKENEEKLK